LKIDHFWRKFVKLQRTPYLNIEHFRRKRVTMRRTPYLKTGKFRRKLVKISEIEAHSLFENWPFSTKIGENRLNWGALLIWKLASFDENWRKSVKLRRTPYLKTGKFRRKLVTFNEFEAPSLFENFQWNRIRRQLLHKRFARATVAGPLWVKDPPRYSCNFWHTATPELR
jgi:hypothetical protein